MKRRPLLASLAVVSGTACAFLYPRHGMEHYVSRESGSGAVGCGSFIREPMQPHSLSAEESARASACMTEAYRSGRPAFFYVAGPGIDSQLGWGLVSTQGSIRRFHYDSAPCGGAGCKERFTTSPCPLPAPGAPLEPSMACADAASSARGPATR
jgi:hypothetical protein